MDLQTIAIVLKAALSPNRAERKAAEDSHNKFQYTLQHLVRLLEIIVDGNCDLAVRQVESIHFKNFIAENWSPHDPGEQSKISPSDKELVRQTILGFVAQVPALLRAQLGECLKTIIHADYPEQWPGLLQWVTHNLQDQQVYGALFVLRILSRKYKPPHLFAHVEPTLLPIMRRMLTTDGQDILVPMDNYVSRSTVHYLTCKEPDYQQSLWIMLSNVMSDKNLEDNDIEPANAHHANTHLPKTSHPNKKTQFQFNKPKMKMGYHCKAQICSLLLIFVFLFGFNLELSLGQHQCQHSHDHEHDHHHHEHHHHHDLDHDHDLSVKKLPEELAEEEDLRMEFASHHHHAHHDHGSGSELLTGVGLWINAMGCSLLVSLASLICLILLPLIFFQGKPSKAFVDALAVFGAGAMLGDAFLHQLPHAFGSGHSHSHDDLAHDHDHAPSHSHSIEDLSVGLSILFGIVVFLLVEKAVRYVEERSGGDSLWGHGHHHHHQKKSESLQDVSGDDLINKQTTRDEGKVSETTTCDEPSLLRKRNTSRNGVGDEIDSAVENGPESNTKSIIEKEPVRPSSLVFGYLNLFSDGVHNFTDGMALGSAFLLYGSVGGWSRTLFLLAHELPQEIGDFGILVRSGFSVFKALFFNFLSALVALAGTALALSLGQDPGQSSLIEGFTAGGFIYIAVGVMAEMNNGSSSLKNSAIQLTSLVMGMSVALFISLIE